MSLEFIRKTYYWLPRVGGGLSGDYEAIAAGDWCTYITDPAGLGPLPAHYKPWPLHPRVPRKIFITGFVIGYAIGTYQDSGLPNDIEMFVDVGSRYFKSAGGAEVGADLTDLNSLFCDFSSMTWKCWQQELGTPVLCDRDAQDRLCIEWAMATGASWTVVGLKYLVPAPSQPVA